MSDANRVEIALDHKHWLAEIERWEGYLHTWSGHQETLVQEMETAIHKHGVQIANHAREIEALKQELVECEGVLAAKDDLAALIERHKKCATLHDQQRNQHERLKLIHHRLMAALALVKGEPFREE